MQRTGPGKKAEQGVIEQMSEVTACLSKIARTSCVDGKLEMERSIDGKFGILRRVATP
jgi:hypothetical protein